MSFRWTKNEKRMNEIVVRQAPIGLKTYSEAKKVGAKAEAILAGHRHDGHSKIEVKRGKRKVDAFVELDDSRGQKAAAAIEFGHKKVNKDGTITGFVPGIAPLRKAAFG